MSEMKASTELASADVATTSVASADVATTAATTPAKEELLIKQLMQSNPIHIDSKLIAKTMFLCGRIIEEFKMYADDMCPTQNLAASEMMGEMCFDESQAFSDDAFDVVCSMANVANVLLSSDFSSAAIYFVWSEAPMKLKLHKRTIALLRVDPNRETVQVLNDPIPTMLSSHIEKQKGDVPLPAIYFQYIN